MFGKFVALFALLAAVNAGTIVVPQSTLESLPVVKTSILGPSGNITQEEHLPVLTQQQFAPVPLVYGAAPFYPQYQLPLVQTPQLVPLPVGNSPVLPLQPFPVPNSPVLPVKPLPVANSPVFPLQPLAVANPQVPVVVNPELPVVNNEIPVQHTLPFFNNFAYYRYL